MTTPENANASLAGEANAENADLTRLHHETNTTDSGLCEVLSVDLVQAQRFLTLLDDGADTWHFRTFHDSQDSDGRNYDGSLDDVAARMQRDNCKGRGAFVVVNEGGHNSKSISRVRAVFADFDPPKTASMPVNLPLEPHVIVESSPGKHHVYWLVDGLPVTEFQATQKAIIAALGSDESVSDLSRVMRLPGFIHQKGAPFRSRIIHESGALPYSADAIRGAFSATDATQHTQNATKAAHVTGEVIADGGRDKTMASLAGSMRKRGMTESEILAALRVTNAERCKPPLPDTDVQRIARSISRYEPAQNDAANDAHALIEVDLADVMQAKPTPPRFVVTPIIPRGVATLLGGHGGLGKSMLGAVMCAHVAAGRGWGPFAVERGRAVFVSLEDPGELVRYRLRCVIDEYQLPAAEVLGNLRVFDGADVEAAMVKESRASGVVDLVELPMMRDVAAAAAGAGLLVIDNASDAFGGDEVDRAQVRSFMRKLARVARANDAGVVLLAHVDKSSAKYGSNGNSYSGSTTWHNSARSRLALIEESGTIELRHEKANLSRKAEPVMLTFAGPVLVPVADGSRKAVEAAQGIEDAGVVLAALEAAWAAGLTVPAAGNGVATSWHVLSTLPELPAVYRTGDGKRRVLAALVRLQRDGLIIREGYTKPNRHPGERWIAAAGVAQKAA